MLFVGVIVDSVLTLSKLVVNVRIRGAKSLSSLASLHKQGASRVVDDVHKIGRKILGNFVPGCGLDYAERYLKRSQGPDELLMNGTLHYDEEQNTYRSISTSSPPD